MASKAANNASPRLTLDRRDTTRLFLVLIGGAILAASLVTPWWTRGFTIDWDEQDNPRPVGAPAEGIYVQYRPYYTPASPAGFSTDAGREAATAVLGVALTLTGLFAATSGILRGGRRLGLLEVGDDAPVRFAMAAFVCGIFAVLWGALFLPLLGPNPGWLYGAESDVPDSSFDGDGSSFVEATRYANVGFFFGIVGAVGFPLYLWVDAHSQRVRNLALQLGETPAPTTTSRKATV